MNKVLLTGRLTRDPEMRSLASGKNVTTFTVASNEFIGGGKEKSEYHPVVAWDRLAEIAGRYLGKGQQVAIEGRLQTRSWDDDKGARHWKTEIVASHVEMLSGRKKKDYEAQQAADSLVAQAEALGESAATEPIAEAAFDPGTTDDEDEEDERHARGRRGCLTRRNIPFGDGVFPSAPSPPPLRARYGRAVPRTRRTTRRGSRRRASAARPRASWSRRRSR